MITATQALFLHHVKHSDSGVILHLYTLSHGHIPFIANGIHSRRSLFKASMLMPLTTFDVRFTLNTKNPIQRLADVAVIAPFRTVPFDPQRNALSVFIAEVVYRTQTSAVPDPPLFNLLLHTTRCLDDPDCPIGNFHLIFLLRYANALGFSPLFEDFCNGARLNVNDGTFSSLSNGGLLLERNESEAIAALTKVDYRNGNSIRLPMEMKKRIVKDLLDFIMIHSEHKSEIHSLEVIGRLFE